MRYALLLLLPACLLACLPTYTFEDASTEVDLCCDASGATGTATSWLDAFAADTGTTYVDSSTDSSVITDAFVAPDINPPNLGACDECLTSSYPCGDAAGWTMVYCSVDTCTPPQCTLISSGNAGTVVYIFCCP